MRNHVPFRNWCPYCLAAKAKERGHFSKGSVPEEEDDGIPRFGLDYGFFSPEFEREQKETAECLKIAVMKEKRTKARFAHVARQKGGEDEHVSGRLAEDIDNMGFKKVILRTDQENSIKTLAERVKVKRGSETQTIPEPSPKGDSQSNGLGEKGIQEVAGQMRVMKLALEGYT